VFNDSRRGGATGEMRLFYPPCEKMRSFSVGMRSRAMGLPLKIDITNVAA